MINGKFGCEIECIVPRENQSKLNSLINENGWSAKGDGSINNYNRETETTIEFLPTNNSRTGEKGVKIQDLPKLIKELEKAFKLIRVNDTCGLHLHLSFEDVSNYFKLCNWKFINHFQDVIKKDFKTEVEKERINKHYCRFYSDEQNFQNEVQDQYEHFDLNYKPSSRYHSINFNAANLYNTVEFRIFAATNSITKFKHYVDLLLKTVEDFCNQETIEPIFFEVKMKKTKINSNEPEIIREIITKKEKKKNE